MNCHCFIIQSEAAKPRQVHDNELKQLKDEISAKNSQLKELRQAADGIFLGDGFLVETCFFFLRRVWERFSGDFGGSFCLWTRKF